MAGVHEIVDRSEVERLAWEREDRWKDEETQNVIPRAIPNQEPYRGTEDVVLAAEEGVTYEPREIRRLRRTLTTAESDSPSKSMLKS